MRAENEQLLLGFVARDLGRLVTTLGTLALSTEGERKRSYEALITRLRDDIQELANTRKELDRDPGTTH